MVLERAKVWGSFLSVKLVCGFRRGRPAWDSGCYRTCCKSILSETLDERGSWKHLWLEELVQVTEEDCSDEMVTIEA